VLDTWRDQQHQWRECPPLAVDLGAYDALLDAIDGAETEGLEALEEPTEPMEAADAN
jgi:hypothetical protein